MRTGKTKQVIDNACWLYAGLEIDAVLVIAPNGVHRAWVDIELPKHCDVYGSAMAWRFSNRDNSRLFESFMLMRNGLQWLTVNSEVIARDDVRRAIKRFCAGKRVMIVFDEAHDFARPGAKRTAAARAIARFGAFNRILTGTPHEENYLQVFSEYELLEREALGHRTFGSFKQRYAVYMNQTTRGGRSFPRLAGYQNVDELRERMARFSSVVLREDCEDLPPLQEDVRIIELTAAQEKLWRGVKKNELEALDEIESQNAVTGGAALVKLQQIEGGFVKGVGPVVPIGSNPKMLALLDEVMQHDGQVLVWFQYIHEIVAAAEMFLDAHIASGMFHGSAKWRERDLAAFMAGKLRVMLAQPAAGGQGRDMSAATLVVWFSQTASATKHAQASERATKVGRASVQLVSLYWPGGVDEYLMKLNQKKVRLADDLSRRGMREILNNMGE